LANKKWFDKFTTSQENKFMKILAWIFIILGTISLFAALTSTINLWTSSPGDFEDWLMNKKIRNRFYINSAVDFVIAGLLFSRAKGRRND